MNPVREFRHGEFREILMEAVLGMLARLPETERNIFIWSHYRGCQSGEIAEILGRSASSVEATLGSLNSILYQKVRALLNDDSELDTETSLRGAVTLQEAELCHHVSRSSS